MLKIGSPSNRDENRLERFREIAAHLGDNAPIEKE